MEHGAESFEDGKPMVVTGWVQGRDGASQPVANMTSSEVDSIVPIRSCVLRAQTLWSFFTR